MSLVGFKGVHLSQVHQQSNVGTPLLRLYTASTLVHLFYVGALETSAPTGSL